MPSACAGNATYKIPLIQEISINQAYKLLYVCDFFVVMKSVKRC
jgi:hypothetical protein